MTKKLVVFGWITTIIFLFLYSFTQIDLGLTLTRASWWQMIQRKFQYIGYFQRPLSTMLYLVILFLLFFFYILILRAVRKGEFKEKEIWKLILLTAGILWLAYNAFSYDLFNYVFDAKIVTYYRQNPYQHKALDYLSDPMLGFMHWTHRTYPYGPTWLLFTVPLSFLGWQKLLPTLILFKGLTIGSFLLACWLIEKILKEVTPNKSLLGLAIFAFNPLVIVESLVSAHNDIVMMALILAAFWLLIKKKSWQAWLLFIASVAIKFATGLFLPVFALVFLWQHRKRKVVWQKVWLTGVVLMTLAIFLAIKRTNLQPWYFLYILPFISLLPEKSLLFWPTTGVSLGLLLNYAPFLYFGNWNPPIPTIKFWLTIIFLSMGTIVGSWSFLLSKRKQ